MKAESLFWLVYVSVVTPFGLLGLAAVAVGDVGLREGVAGTAWAALLAGAA
jgi:hypothetical protein